MIVLETTRLRLRELAEQDDGFMLDLLNSPDFLRNIGDRGVRTHEQARRYLREGPIASYAQHGFGMYLVERRSDGTALGLCGLVRRETLPGVDIGFAFLPQYCAQGYGSESAIAMLAHARQVLRLDPVLAIVLPENVASVKLLERLGLRYQRELRLAGDGDLLHLYSTAPE